ncbi:MAG: hypothetical protein VX730_08960 [Pseudomonadota bacterium]|nr:hypothetical protein [Pseudomonadota bacterium]
MIRRSGKLLLPAHHLKRVFLVLSNNALMTVLRFVTVAMISHYLAGVPAINTFFYFYSVAIFFNSVSDFGLHTTLTIHASDDEYFTNRKKVATVLGYRVIFGITCFISFILFTHIAGNLSPELFGFGLALALFASNPSLADPFMHMLRGRQYELVETSLRVAEAFITMLSVLLVMTIYEVKTLNHIALAMSAPTLIRLAISAYIFHRIKPIEFNFNMRDLYEQFRSVFFAGLSFLLSSFLMRAPILMAPILMPGTAIAKLTISMMLVQASQMMSTPVSQYVLTRVKRKNPKKPKDFDMRIMAVPPLFYALGLVAAVFVIGVAQFDMQLFGIELRDTNFYILCATLPIFLVGDFLRFFYIYIGRTQLFFVLQCLIVLFYFAAFFALKPYYPDVALVAGFAVAHLCFMLVAIAIPLKSKYRIVKKS